MSLVVLSRDERRVTEPSSALSTCLGHSTAQYGTAMLYISSTRPRSRYVASIVPRRRRDTTRPVRALKLARTHAHTHTHTATSPRRTGLRVPVYRTQHALRAICFNDASGSAPVDATHACSAPRHAQPLRVSETGSRDILFDKRRSNCRRSGPASQPVGGTSYDTALLRCCRPAC